MYFSRFISYRLLYVIAVLLCIGFVIVYLIAYQTSTDEEVRTPLPSSQHPMITIHTNGGRLGNQMFTYAALFGLSSLNKRTMQIMPNNFQVLNKYFDIQTPVMNKRTFREVDPYFIGNWLKEEDRHIPESSNIIKGNIYPTSYTFFDHIRERIREVFRFRPSYRKHAQDILWEIKRQRPNTQVYVGVHVRRGDYLLRAPGGWLRDYEGREVDMEYFERAMKHFTSKYDNVTFLALSDDRGWCRTNLSHLGILTTPESPSAGHDLALLSFCNHTIMTYGTYGFWGGYLGGGEVVYFADFLKPTSKFVKDYFAFDKMYPPDWIGISTTKPGFWESYTNPFMR